MLIGTLPHANQRLRLGFLGSCRLHDPIKAAMPEFEGAFEWSSHNAFTHSPEEALQHLRFCLGQIEIPDPFAPYILRQDATPLLDPKLAELAASCDALIVEISSFEMLRCGAYLFNSDYFAQTFVRGKGMALLDWFRDVSDRRLPDAATAEAALEASGNRASPSFTEILQTMRKEDSTDGAARRSFTEISAVTRHLILLPIFNVPGGNEALVGRRAALAQRVSQIATDIGLGCLDTAELIEEAGSAAALDGQGADIFHYAPAFLPTMGRFLLGQIVALATAEDVTA